MSDFPLSALTSVSGRPLRRTVLTSGSGTFTPLNGDSIARVVLVGAGGGGAGASPSSPYGQGGAGGMTVNAVVRLTGSQSYSVGTGGAGGSGDPTAGNGSDGGSTYLGNLIAFGGPGGARGITTYGTYAAGIISNDGGADTYTSAQCTGSQVTVGGGGGYGNSATQGMGKGVGHHLDAWTAETWPAGGAGGSAKGGGGGSSVYGEGGDGGQDVDTAGSDGGGYGGGGGAGTCNVTSASHMGAIAGGSGAGGLIIIEEWSV